MLERIERNFIRNGKPIKLIEIREKELPKELRWTKQIKMLMEKGYIPKYVYDGIEYDIPKGELDSEGQSFIPKLPDKIKILKYVPGKGFVQVTEFEGRSRIDPEPEVAMNLWKIFGI